MVKSWSTVLIKTQEAKVTSNNPHFSCSSLLGRQEPRDTSLLTLQTPLDEGSPGKVPRVPEDSQSRQNPFWCLGQAEGWDPGTAVISSCHNGDRLVSCPSFHLSVHSHICVCSLFPFGSGLGELFQVRLKTFT